MTAGSAPPVEVRRIEPAQWRVMRGTRLAMLLDRPSAFGSTFEREVAYPDDLWRERAATPVFLAWQGTLPVGSATLYSAPGASCPEIVAMWVAGHARGQGVGDQLVAACLEEAVRSGAQQVTLHVMDDNPAARRVYERAGFRMTGGSGDVPSCREMARPVGEVNSA